MESKILGGRYELSERIGMGGMAIVYKATDTLLGRSVAIKILREEFAFSLNIPADKVSEYIHTFMESIT